MKRFALLTATLMLGGAALAQDTGYDDPTTPDTAVSSDTSSQADTTTNEEATTTSPSTTDVMSDTDASTTTTPTSTTATDAATGTSTTTTSTGVGGPYEPAPAPTASMPMASTIPAQTSRGGYPPCDGSASADSCIQLYERGVKTETNLAMNNSLPGGDQTMTASAETATPSGQVSADATMSSTPASTEPATGVGGPYEPVGAASTSTTDYRPCAPGPGDDSCIQLYERGVRSAKD